MKQGFFNAAKIGGDYERFTEEVRRGTPAAAFGVSSAVKYLLGRKGIVCGDCRSPFSPITEAQKQLLDGIGDLD